MTPEARAQKLFIYEGGGLVELPILTQITQAIAKAVKEENEACAEIADYSYDTHKEIAAAIRARNED